jgi:hypothetical protein
VYQVETNRLVPILTPLFFGWIISLKGFGHKMNIFLRPIKLNVLSVHAQMVFEFLVCLVQEKIKKKFLFASLKTLTIIVKIVPKAALKFYAFLVSH